jgi:hypothetical protein
MESFFYWIKVEQVPQQRWAPRDEAQQNPFSSIEGYYNRQRIHSASGVSHP